MGDGAFEVMVGGGRCDGMESFSHSRALTVSGVTKRYPGVVALNEVNLEVSAGQILGLAGANGAGKSTLVKILSGAEQPDDGRVFVGGEQVRLTSPHAARRAGIYTVYQEMSLVPQLSVAENVFLDDLACASVVRQRALERQAAEWLNRFQVSVDVRSPVSSLSLAKQQLVEIIKAWKSNPRLLLLDEPTTTLPSRDVNGLFQLMRELAAAGVGIIFISHRLSEVTSICDTVSVLRDGESVEEFGRVPSEHEIVKAMVGPRYEGSFSAAATEGTDARLGGVASDRLVLEVDQLSAGQALSPTSLKLHRKEILGITGLLGSGQMELGEALFGARKPTSGECRVEGRKVRIGSPRRAIRAGIGLLPEDRKSQGLVLGMRVDANMTLASIDAFVRGGILRRRAEVRHARMLVDHLGIKCRSVAQQVGTMSGGNQQKVLLARWLVKKSKALVLIEPTRGVDVAAKEEIYQLVRQYLGSGGAVIMVTSDLSEAAMCDRIIVMASGRIAAEASHAELQESPSGEFLQHLG